MHLLPVRKTMNTRADPEVESQRRHRRVVVSWPANIQAASGGPVPLRVVDVSHGGMAVLSEASLPTQGLFCVAVRTPSPHNSGQSIGVSVHARLIHQVFDAGRNRAGLRFVHIGLADTEFLMSCALKRV
jgi:c-di-GMP-binding flagellar brake protein YcgR